MNSISISKKQGRLLHWLLFLGLSLPAIILSPMAMAFLEPVRSIFESLHIGHGTAIAFGLLQLAGGILLFSGKTYRAGLLLLFVFAFSILSLKAFYVIMGHAFAEVGLILLILLADYLGYPRK